MEDYRVVSLGIHPSIAQYNGFYTLDGYFVDYPLAYKYQFRSIIEDELRKDSELQEYFDGWGSRAYIFTEQLGRDFIQRAGNQTVLSDLDLNLEAFNALGGAYILSAVRIDEVSNPQYQLLNTFEHPDSAWDIYLYAPTSSEIGD